MGDVQIPHIAAEMFRAGTRYFQRGPRKDQHKFVAAVPAGDVLAANLPHQKTAHFSQQRVSRFMPKLVVIALEVIGVEQNYSQGSIVPDGASDLSLERFFQV